MDRKKTSRVISFSRHKLQYSLVCILIHKLIIAGGIKRLTRASRGHGAAEEPMVGPVLLFIHLSTPTAKLPRDQWTLPRFDWTDSMI